MVGLLIGLKLVKDLPASVEQTQAMDIYTNVFLRHSRKVSSAVGELSGQ